MSQISFSVSLVIDDTPRGSAVSVGVTSRQSTGRDAQQFLHIAVTDTCPSIPPKICERMFEKFFRLEHHHADGTNGARGAGIGRYLCRQIIEVHGGKIWCEPGDNDCGTRIAFYSHNAKRLRRLLSNKSRVG